MKRRGFLARVLAVAAGCKISELCNSEIERFHVETSDPYYGWSELEKAIGAKIHEGGAWAVGWNGQSTGHTLDEMTLKVARDRLLAMPSVPTVFDRRIYERTGLLVPL